MKEIDKIKDQLEAQLDKLVFGTNDPQVIKREFHQAFEAWEQQRGTLGGYLRNIREKRGLTSTDCASKVGVPRQTWQLWESDREIPSDRDLEQICAGLHFGDKKKARLQALRRQAPGNLLLLVSRCRPLLQAAKGANIVGSAIGWSHLPDPIQQAVVDWGKEHGYHFPDQLPGFFLTLQNEEQRQSWVSEIIGGAEHGLP